MTTYIYYGGTHALRLEAITQAFDPKVFLTTTIDPEPSISVKDIRDLLTSLQSTSPVKRLILFPRAQALTKVAQNALLKTLEEPPSATTFVLAVTNLSQLLPTVRSRAVSVSVKGQITTRNDLALSLIKEALSAPAGQRVNLADTVAKTREEALTFFDSLLATLHTVIKDGASHNQLKVTSQLGELASATRAALQANTNPTLAIREFFLSLPRTSMTARME